MIRGTLFVILGACLLRAATMVINVNTTHKWTDVDANFLSVAIDASVIAKDFKKTNLTSPKLIALARGLSGKSSVVSIYLRVGGSSQDLIVYKPTGLDSLAHYTMNNTEWDDLNQFARLLNWKLVFGLNVLTERKPDGAWDPKNAIRLFMYSQRKGYQVDYQLGNEPGLFPSHHNVTISPEQLADDFALLKIVSLLVMKRQTCIIGPDVTLLTKNEYFAKFVASVEREILSAVSYHFYYGPSTNVTAEDFTNPEYMDRFLSHSAEAKRIIRGAAHLTGTPIWISETSSTYGGGSAAIGMSYVAGFLYLDKLGIAAQMNVSVLVKQTLVNGFYSLLESGTYDPTPSYWIAAIYKQLVGTRVLDITGLLQFNRTIRLYAHCANPFGGHGYAVTDVVVFGVNVDGKEATSLSFEDELGKLEVDQYLLTPAEGKLTDRDVKLNGKVMKMTSPTSVPSPMPIRVPQPVAFPAFSYGFFVLRGAKAEACMGNSIPG